MEAGQRASVALHTSPLTDPVDRAGLREYRARLPPSLRPSILPIVGIVLAGGILILFAGGLRGERLPEPGQWIASVPYLAIPAILILSAVRSLRKRNGHRQYRLFRFANANGLGYEPLSGPLAWPGMIFDAGKNAAGHDLVHGPDGLVVGNYRYVTGSGKQRRVHLWGFAALRLGTELPHIVLDAKSNNSVLGSSNLPSPFDRAQRLGLEGDFDRYFALLCPAGYESDALYLFTPDIMARFIDHAAEFDVEIVDDRLYLYSRRDLSTLDPETWVWLWATLDALADKIARWERWRDGRLGSTTVIASEGAQTIVRPPRGVAPAGRRLHRKSHWIWVVIGLAFVAVFGFNFFFAILRNFW